ncbi:alpha/beta hydrolase fold domain-containing protein [Enterococcus sp. 2201sp1_2201st1_B8_2201SCRN_220225]|uniref:alpha/beta hydrolase fold domain-containing protein n=1 Tax=unclassified Enterococcus TaxID=2608891 RepID=UPI0034A26106
MRFSANFVKQVFKVINMKKIVGANMVTPPKRREITLRQLKRSDLPQRKEMIEDSPLITLFPEHPTNRHVFYLHGGGYALEASPFHKEIQAGMVATGLKVSYFDYPLAPENTAEITLSRTLAAFSRLSFLYPDDRFYFFGDSAGGGLALSVAQQLKAMDHPHRPLKLALVSPWLDLTLEDPRVALLQAQDVLLERNRLKEAAKNYAGNLSLTDPRVSPLFGDLSYLGELFVISGTADILHPDVLRLKDLVEQTSGTHLILESVTGMMHDFVVYPLKESEPYRNQIHEFYWQ